MLYHIIFLDFLILYYLGFFFYWDFFVGILICLLDIVFILNIYIDFLNILIIFNIIWKNVVNISFNVFFKNLFMQANYLRTYLFFKNSTNWLFISLWDFDVDGNIWQLHITDINALWILIGFNLYWYAALLYNIIFTLI